MAKRTAKAKKNGKRRVMDPSEGGKALVEQRGPEYMAELGRKSAAKRDPDHYRRMAAASAIARKRIMDAGKAALARGAK